jgi:nicotinamide phosphoribosyltransferase
MTNIILATDSYKLNHWNQYPKDTEGVYSYLEARQGAEYDNTVFFGLQSIIKNYLEGAVVRREDIIEAENLAAAHFGRPGMFNRAGWMHILEEHGGRLPVRIKAVPEGTVVPTGNVLMTVENTDPECFWLTNALESVLMHVWHPTTVASRSRAVKAMLANKLLTCGATLDGLPFMLHDFGYRGAASHESAALGGAGHLVNFLGTDTLPAMQLALQDYGADLATLAFSVPATEHSVMTALGRGGEMDIVERLLDEYPEGILSVVADSYNIYEFVRYIGSRLKRRIMERDGVFVVRPDSTTLEDPTPGTLTRAILESLWMDFGGETNAKGFKVLDPHVRVLWGDGIDENGIEKIVNDAMLGGFSPENLVFGMGGGLLQKLNRDTQRFAFKASAIKRGGEWCAVQKKPLDESKASKKGRLRLAFRSAGEYVTLGENEVPAFDIAKNNVMRTVFEDGRLLVNDTFEQVRERAAL